MLLSKPSSLLLETGSGVSICRLGHEAVCFTRNHSLNPPNALS